MLVSVYVLALDLLELMVLVVLVVLDLPIQPAGAAGASVQTSLGLQFADLLVRSRSSSHQGQVLKSLGSTSQLVLVAIVVIKKVDPGLTLVASKMDQEVAWHVLVRTISFGNHGSQIVLRVVPEAQVKTVQCTRR